MSFGLTATIHISCVKKERLSEKCALYGTTEMKCEKSRMVNLKRFRNKVRRELIDFLSHMSS